MPTKATKKNTSAPASEKSGAKQLAELSPRLLQYLLRLNAWVPPGDLTSQQFKVLQNLALAGKPMTMSEVARSLGLSQSTLSETVKRLVLVGYLTRQRLSEDDRVVSVTPTKKGRLVAKQAKARLLAAYEKIGGSISGERMKRFVDSHLFIADVLRSWNEE